MDLSQEYLTRGDVYEVLKPSIEDSHDLAHPSTVCEGSLLGAVPKKNNLYNMKWQRNINLSNIQLLAVNDICYRHEQFLMSGFRAGFLLGDGTGMGKTRTICATVLENIACGRKLHVIITVSSALELDFMRELSVLNANDIQMYNLKTFKLQEIKEGVIFTTYTKLHATENNMELASSICEFLGPDFDGLLVFDECHMAKNYIPSQNNKCSKTGASVIFLQEKLKNSRVLYVSATGMGDSRHFAYLPRLGLWGPGSPCTNAKDFLFKVDKGGVAMMEYVAYHLKKTGAFLSRHISMDGVKFNTVKVDLNEEFSFIYDKSTELWRLIYDYATEEAEELGASIMSVIAGTQLRYFATLVVSAKVSKCIELTNTALNAGKQVVIGLQGTGEALYRPAKSNSPFSLLRAMLNNIIENILCINFSDLTYTQSEDLNHKELLAIKIKNKFHEISDKLPRNPLDLLIESLGSHENVAEITGRTRREKQVLKNSKTEYVEEIRRNTENQNITERNFFQTGLKKICIISDAASVGISLHADPTHVAHGQVKPRLQITLEFPWSADKLVQQLGRTHRSNEVFPPEYVMLITNVPGEKRFTSIISERLSYLGALTQGDSRSVLSLCGHIMPADQGREILKSLANYFNEMEEDDDYELVSNCIESQIFQKKTEKEINLSSSCRSMTTFYNRVLGMKLNSQKKITEILESIVDSLEEHQLGGVLVLGQNFKPIRIKQSWVPNTNKKIILTKAIYNLGVEFPEIWPKPEIFAINLGSNIIHAGSVVENYFVLRTPFSSHPLRLSNITFRADFSIVDASTGEELWKKQYSANKCVEFYRTVHGSQAVIGILIPKKYIKNDQITFSLS